MSNQPQVIKVATTAAIPATYSERLRMSPRQAQGPLPRHSRCCICSCEHSTMLCDVLQSYPIDRREYEVKQRRLCFRCLESGHLSRNCVERRPTCDHCGLGHLTILHHDVGNPSHPAQNQQQYRQQQQQLQLRLQQQHPWPQQQQPKQQRPTVDNSRVSMNRNIGTPMLMRQTDGQGQAVPTDATPVASSGDSTDYPTVRPNDAV